MNKAEDFVTQYEIALATQKWKEVAPLIHRDCKVTFSDGTCHHFHQESREAGLAHEISGSGNAFILTSD